MHSHKGMVSIWFFIGLLLVIYGLLTLGASVYDVYVPPPNPVVLANLHAGVYWGILMLLLGLFWTLRFRPRA